MYVRIKVARCDDLGALCVFVTPVNENRRKLVFFD
jgi:hypothetical protein